MFPFTLLITAFLLCTSSLASPISSDSRIRLRGDNVINIPDSVPFRSTQTISGIAASGTGGVAPKNPFAIALQEHEAMIIGGSLPKRDEATELAPEAPARLEGIALPEAPTPPRGPSNVRALAFSMHSFLKLPPLRRRTPQEIQPSPQIVTRAASKNSTNLLSAHITSINDINVKTVATSGRHNFMKFGG